MWEGDAVAPGNRFYVVQPMWRNGLICGAEEHLNDASEALERSRAIFYDPTFEGDAVRVITADGEFVSQIGHTKA